jgi:hypothetical protein
MAMKGRSRDGPTAEREAHRLEGFLVQGRPERRPGAAAMIETSVGSR